MFDHRTITLSLLVFVAIQTLTLISAGEQSGSVIKPADFAERYCVECHGASDAEADFALEPLHKAGAHETWHRAWNQIESREMPPEDADQPSEAERQAVLEAIVVEHGEVLRPMSDGLWSLSAPKRAVAPEVESVIDFLIDRRLQQDGLARSPRADRRTLLRRLTLDLTGLLPTIEDTDAFLDDPDDFQTAYGRVVDRLLASPRYGERWAMHWLDVIRWAETVGFETNLPRNEAYHYRDWVIRAFNEDLPYDQFVTAQLTGDETGDDAALGFLVSGPANLPGQIGRDEESMRQARQDELDEVVQTVSQSMFALTVGCARCHDHKFDPISQQDYYNMQAVFAGLKYGTRRLRGETNNQWTQKVPAARERLESLQSEIETLRRDLDLREPITDVHRQSFSATHTDAIRLEIEAMTNGPASLYEFEVWTAESADRHSANVALASAGATPSASSFALANQSRHFDNLVDGSVDQRQSFAWVAAKEGPAWIQIDFAKSETIDRVSWYRGNSAMAGYVLKVRDPDTNEWIVVDDSSDRFPRSDDTRPASDIELDGVSPEQTVRIVKLLSDRRRQQSELNRLSRGPQTYAASFSNSPEKLWLLRRGDPMQRGDESIAAVPEVLASRIPSSNPASEIDRRRLLANHLTRTDHPLTARVMVNRIWQHHFGVGLVETASDFGRMGRPPTHPELLDELAIEFVENDWSIKHLHRLMVTSGTYMQASYPRADAAKIDAQCRLLWRFPPRRLEAEAIRDCILHASGKLNPKMYGRGFDFFNQRGGLSDYHPKETFDPEGWRRMIYAHKIRMQSVDVFGAFDCPDAGQMTPRRNQSITPVQSLGLLNSPFVNRQSGFFAERVGKLASADLATSIRTVFCIALTRHPEPSEEAALLELAQHQGLIQVCRVIFNTSEFVSLR